jgi:6-phosphogluconolactonase
MEGAGMNNYLHQFNNKSELHIELANIVASLLQKSISTDTKAILAVSGGSTPKPFFNELSKINIPWQNVFVTLVDERWVGNTHKDSNEKLVREHLLQNLAKKASFIPLKNSSPTPFEGQWECNDKLRNLGKDIDVAVLGMGTDGHTASFFPKDENLDKALHTKELCIATIPSDAPHQRITLSLNTLLKTKHLFLHIEGKEKKAVYEKALKPEPKYEMPIRALLRAEKTLEVYYGK